MSSSRPCADCGHRENEHRSNGCLAIIDDGCGSQAICPCVDYQPGRDARAPIRSLGERGRAHERRMRKLRPIVFARDGYRCRATIPGTCTEHAAQAHHLWPSEKGGPDVEENLLSVCDPCHAWIHNEHPTEARDLGLLRDRL